jgi:von Willebrand factor type A domain
MQCYQCVECGTYYAEQKVNQKGVVIEQVPDSLVCQLNDRCQTVGLCADIELSIDEVVNEVRGIVDENRKGNDKQAKESGLCLFLMDASGSMGEHAFGTTPRPTVLKPEPHPNDFNGVENKGYMSKREMVALAAARAVFELRLLSNKEDAHIGIILYDHRQETVFFKSVEKIFKDNTDANVFAKDLLKRMKDMNGGTNINGALNMAENLVKKFEEGKIDALGNFYPMEQNLSHYYDINTGNRVPNGTIVEKNIRVMLYTDGEQLADYGALKSPFEFKSPVDPLICAYIGQANTRGGKELRSIVRYCPVHGEPQMIVVDRVQAFPTLHGIFRMASGGSGFCEKCLKINMPTSDKKAPTTDH